MTEPAKTTSGPRKCAQCGAELPVDAAPDLCPKCLLKQALAGATAVTPSDVLPGIQVRSGGLPAAGQQFGHYRILRPLGGGGMGTVFEAEDLESSRRVALKVLGHALDSPEARERFFREGRLAASINHPNSVYVFGTEEIAGTPVIAMELVPGGTLEDRIRAQGPMRPAEAVDAMLQIIAGLEQAQRLGILHRDVKPSNCFVDGDGTVKIGDFGLSISTAIRTEPAVTASGTFLGTPAFCSPEQLRGEELNARSDIYSVGSTLFYLLTGRTPFQAKNIVALIATILEHPAPSPRQLNPKLPLGLDRAVRRCLEKQAGERFKTYGELADALAPYSSSAPVPAPLGLRFLAGFIDIVFLGACSLLVLALKGLDPLQLLNQATEQTWKWAVTVAFGASVSLGYYAVLEGRWGAAVGKRLCALRVIGPEKSAPGFARALLRALIYVVLPLVPLWLILGFNPKSYLGQAGAVQFLPNFIFYGMLALLFCTARKRNGYAALQDLATRTRVVARMALPARPALSAGGATPTHIESQPRLGPYHIIEKIQVYAGGSWLLGYDLRLLRKVWIRTLQPGTPQIPTALRNIGRIGRLRWLTGRRSPEENWDAFEAISGKPLLDLLTTPQPWQQVRFWLLDLAQELASAQTDGTLPEALTLDRVWITGEGRAKLLDFPAPGVDSPNSVAPATATPPPLPDSAACQRFLAEFANAALSGERSRGSEDPAKLPLPLPLHAREWLKTIPAAPGLDSLIASLRPLLQKPAIVTRQRRAAIVAGCLVLPLLMSGFAIFGIQLVQRWNQQNPGLFELMTLLQDRWGRSLFGQKDAGPSDRDLEIYISSHYRSLITNQATWTTPLALSLIKGDNRRFAEKSLVDFPEPQLTDIEQANKVIQPRLPTSELPDPRKQPLFLAGIFFVLIGIYVGVPAVLAAVLFRRGLVLVIAGVSFVRPDGRKASRGRLFWRSLVTWSPFIPAFLLTAQSIDRHETWSGLPAILGVLALTMISIILPRRGLPDRLAGTVPVPR